MPRYLTHEQRRGHDLLVDTPWGVAVRVKPNLVAAESLCCRDLLIATPAGLILCGDCAAAVPARAELASIYWNEAQELLFFEALIPADLTDPLSAVLLADELVREVAFLRRAWRLAEEQPWRS